MARFSKSTMCDGALNLLAHCRVDCIVVDGSDSDDEHVVKFVRGLPSGIKSLTVVMRRLFDLVVDSNEIDLDMPPTAVVSYPFKMWNISRTFPLLQSLEMTQTYSNDHPIGVRGWRNFLATLPSTLTELDIPAGHVEWASLPPTLCTLKSVFNPLPLPDSLLNSLTTWTAVFNKQAFYHYGVKDTVDIAVVTFPRNLTSLELEYDLDGELSASKLLALPPSLLTFEWSGSGDVGIRSLLLMIPATATHVKIDGFSFPKNFKYEDSATIGPLSFPNITRFDLHYGTKRASEEVEEALYGDVFRTLSGLKSLLLQSGPQRGLKASHLNILKKAPIDTIFSKFHDECFLPIDGKYPITECLPKLTEMWLSRSKVEFAFASVPRSIKTLYLDELILTSEQFLECPKELVMLVSFDFRMINGPALDSIFSDPHAQPLTLTDGSKTTMPLSSFSARNGFELEYIFGDTPSGREQRSYIAPSSRFCIQPHFTEPNLLPLPRGLTRLDVNKEMSAPDKLSGLTPALLPYLTELRLDKPLPAGLDLGAFKELLKLEINSFAKDCTSACPPHLTSLIGLKFEFPSSFLPLPDSLTLVDFKELLKPLSSLASLPNLTSLKAGRPAVSIYEHNLFIEFLAAPHPRITELGLPVLSNDNTKKVLATLPNFFPSLSKLEFRGGASYSSLWECQSRIPSLTSIIGGELNSFDDASALALHLGFSAGNLPKFECSSLLALAHDVARRLRPQWKVEVATDLLSPSWAVLAPLLSPNVQSLTLTSFSNLKHEFLHLLPASLTELRMEAELRESDNFPQLPNSLMKLSVMVLKLTVELIAALPRNLLDLELTVTHVKSEKLSGAHALALPPSLTRVCFGVSIAEDAFFSSLPSGLLYIKLDDASYSLKPENVLDMPPSVRFYEGKLTLSALMKVEEISKTHNRTYIDPEADNPFAIRRF